MDGEFIQTYGSLSLFVPRLDLVRDLVDSSTNSDASNTSNFSIGSPLSHQIFQLISDKSTNSSRMAAFYDENLPYYIQLNIQNSSASPHYIADPTNEAFLRFLQQFRIVVDVVITGNTANPGPDPKRNKNNKHRYELFTTALNNSSLVYVGKLDQENGSTEPENSQSNKADGQLWTAIWRINTPITHPRVRLFKPQVVINATASYTGATPINDDMIVPKLSNAVSMLNIRGDKSASEKDAQSSFSGQNTFVPDPNATEVTIKYLGEFEPVEDTNLFGPLNSDKNLKPIRSRLAATRLISSAPAKVESEPLEKTQNVPASPSTNKTLAKIPDLSHQSSPKSPRDASHSHMQSIYSIDNNEINSAISAEVCYPVYPAVNLRLRCTKATGIQDSIVAILEIDNSENSLFSVLVKSAVLDFAAGSAIRFGKMSFPLWLSPGESSSIAYNLNHPDAGLPQTRVKPMTIILDSIPVLGDVTQEKLEADVTKGQAGLDQDNEDNSDKLNINYKKVGPNITTKWDTIVDFGVVAPPTPGATALSTPVNLASASGGVKKLFKVSRSSSQVSLKSHQGSVSSLTGTGGSRAASSANGTNTATTSQLNGLVLSFSAPSAVKVGEIFSWRVFAINKSFSNRHLTLYIQPRDSDRGNGSGVVSNASSTIPILDQISLQRLYEDLSLNGSGTGIVSLMNDVRIGPLSSQACYETEIKMLALSPGQFTLEGLTVVDLTTGDSYDCGRLLDVIVSN